MSTLAIVGIGVYLASHGLRGLPNMSVVGCAGMIVGGVLVILEALV